MKSQRFTLDGSPAVEQHLANSCRRVLECVQTVIPKTIMEGLLLGGGYGRGEGGVLQTSAGDRPYNDLEFYLFLRGWSWWNARKFGPLLHRAADELSAEVGIEVEFKVLSLEKLRRSPTSMFYYDLVSGHRWLYGGEPLLAGCEHHRLGGHIPPAEATRLLMNRCSGLLFAREKLERPELTAEAADFIGRNQAKTKLALGDVVLVLQGQYHWSARTRHERLLRLNNQWPWLGEVQILHQQGLNFKLQPYRAPPDLPLLLHQQQRLTALAQCLWLWLENCRLGRNFASARAYALNNVNKCPETNVLRNVLVNFTTFGLRAFLRRDLFRYPRQRVFHALALLLWDSALLDNPELLHRVQHELSTSAVAFPKLVSAYRKLWSRFN